MSKIYQDQPLTIYLDTGVDLTALSLTDLAVSVRKPSGTEVSWDASLSVDATPVNTGNNWITYDCVKDTDLDEEGIYSLQASVNTAGDDGPWLGDAVSLKVWAAHS